MGWITRLGGWQGSEPGAFPPETSGHLGATTDMPHLNGTLGAMRTTIDKAGRVVVPAALRAQLGLVPGPVEITADGSGIRVEPATVDRLETEQGFLILGDGPPTDADAIRELRLADQR